MSSVFYPSELSAAFKSNCVRTLEHQRTDLCDPLEVERTVVVSFEHLFHKATEPFCALDVAAGLLFIQAIWAACNLSVSAQANVKRVLLFAIRAVFKDNLRGGIVFMVSSPKPIERFPSINLFAAQHIDGLSDLGGKRISTLVWVPNSLPKALLCEAKTLAGRTNLLSQIWRQLAEIREVKCVNPIGSGPDRAAYQQRVVNLRSTPSAGCNSPQGFDVILFSDRHHFEMQQNVLSDDVRRLRWVDPRLHRQARKGRVNFGDRVNAHEPLIFSIRNAPQRRPCLCVMRVAFFRRSH